MQRLETAGALWHICGLSYIPASPKTDSQPVFVFNRNLGTEAGT
jgi:hypothetical protein